MNLKSSVLIPSYGRPEALARCLGSLSRQDCQATEVIVVWQGSDEDTRKVAEQFKDRFTSSLRIIHSSERGVVPAENLALEKSIGDVVLLIDDDAVAPSDWIGRHLSHFRDEKVGAVGGPAMNYTPCGAAFPVHAVEPIGRLTWWGMIHGNMYDHPPEWADRGYVIVDHLVGYNMSFRRSAVSRFETRLKPYWQLFELEACLLVRRAGLKVVFDYGLIVEHHPTNTAFCPGRTGDLEQKVFNPCYNRAVVLAKHTTIVSAFFKLGYLLLVGSTGSPGLIAFFVAVRRGGSVTQEWMILLRCWRETLCGWAVGWGARMSLRANSSTPLQASRT